METKGSHVVPPAFADWLPPAFDGLAACFSDSLLFD